MQQKTLLIVIIGVLIVATGAWFLLSNGEAPSQNTATEPSSVVARVNGEDITRAELEDSEAQIAAQQGADIASLDAESREQLQKQVLDGLVANMLIQQAIVNSGLTVTEAEITTQIEMIKGQFTDDAQFQEVLLEQGLSEADLREQVRGEVATQAYFEQALDLESITVTEEEIQARYEQEAAAGEGIPPFEDARGQIELFVIQQKQQELLMAHVQELRASAEIEILI